MTAEAATEAPTACKRTVSGSLSLASRRSFHLSLTVLVHYRSRPVFSLGGWSPQIQSGFLGPRPTRDPRSPPYPRFAYRTLTSCRGPFQAASAPKNMCGGHQPHRGPTTPRRTRHGLGSSPFDRLYSGNLDLISLPPGTEMFQFPGSASTLRWMTGHDTRRVPPFGYPRITGCLLLPWAFRSLPRPSSPGRA
jgi:hypothetical protein